MGEGYKIRMSEFALLASALTMLYVSLSVYLLSLFPKTLPHAVKLR